MLWSNKLMIYRERAGGSSEADSLFHPFTYTTDALCYVISTPGLVPGTSSRETGAKF